MRRRPDFAFRPSLDRMPYRIAPVDMTLLVYSIGGAVPTLEAPEPTTATGTTLDPTSAFSTTVMVQPTVTPTC